MKVKNVCLIFLYVFVIIMPLAFSGCFFPNESYGNGNFIDENNSQGGNDSNNNENVKHEFFAGIGTEYDPYVIAEPYQWNNINNHLSSYFTLSNDLNMGDFKEIDPIGSDTAPFKGYIDGNNHSISYANLSAKKMQDCLELSVEEQLLTLIFVKVVLHFLMVI